MKKIERTTTPQDIEKLLRLRAGILLGFYKADLELFLQFLVSALGPAAAILAEVGDAKRFSNGKQIATWKGLVPSVYQSAGTFVLGLY